MPLNVPEVLHSFVILTYWVYIVPFYLVQHLKLHFLKI